MANLGRSFGEPAKKYAVNIAVEQVTGNYIESTYSNENMQRGHEQEPLARDLYEQENFCDVSNGGFFDCGFVGCSPDGLVDDDGLIEIKSVLPHVHYANIKRNNVDPAYKWQCIANLYHTGRDWIDFVSYCQDFPDNKKLFQFRMNRHDYLEEFKTLNDRQEEFKSLVDDILLTIRRPEGI